MFSSEYSEIFKNTYFEKHLQATTSVNSRAAATSGISWQHTFQFSWYLFALLTVAPFLRTQSIMMGFWFILVTSIIVTWPSSFSGHRFKLESKDFIFHILQRNFSNFGMKILVRCSAKSQSF